jgi:hypothetical protein
MRISRVSGGRGSGPLLPGIETLGGLAEAHPPERCESLLPHKTKTAPISGGGQENFFSDRSDEQHVLRRVRVGELRRIDRRIHRVVSRGD